MGLVAQTVQSSNVITGEQWIARTPPKRQVEGSNPSEPASISLLKQNSRKKEKEMLEQESDPYSRTNF